MKRFLVISTIVVAAFFFSFTAFYTYWNNASPEQTCASCHEISPSVQTMAHSAHRNESCFSCHGTALGNGIHSLKEKSRMIYVHLTDTKYNDEIKMSEAQVLEVSERCASCHQSEQVKWASGGHATTYDKIFLDEKHNKMERLYWDCFRCHGMYYEGTIYDLVEPVDTKGPWNLKDPLKADHPTIPCLTCHQMHTPNTTIAQDTLFAVNRNPSIGMYLRSDKMHLRADYLGMPDIIHDGAEVSVSEDVNQKLCIQCHSPVAVHEAGTSDDRTPTGVHEGLSCIACHDPHSNDATNSCQSCHPALSNCGIDVKMMNTTFSNPMSEHNIHFVECSDCHDDDRSLQTAIPEVDRSRDLSNVDFDSHPISDRELHNIGAFAADLD